jgi:chromosome segregation ATPase
MAGGAREGRNAAEPPATTPPRSPPDLRQLESVVRDLEQQLAEIKSEHAEVMELRTEVALGLTTIADFEAQVRDNEQKLKIAKLQNARLEEQIAQLQRQLDSKRQQSSDKEKILEQLQMDITSLSADCQRAYDRIKEQRSKSPPRSIDFEPFESFDDGGSPQSFEPPPIRQPSPPTSGGPRTVPRSPAALVDNISFGERSQGSQEPAPSQCLSGLSATLEDLQAQKAKLQWRVQRTAPPGVSLATARRDREELEDALDEVDRKIGRVKMNIRQMS